MKTMEMPVNGAGTGLRGRRSGGFFRGCLAVLAGLWVCHAPVARAATSTSLSFDAAGGTKTATFALSGSSAVTGGAPTVSASWLSATRVVRISGGQTTLTFTIKAAANTSSSSRSGTVKADVNGVYYTVNVTQSGTGKPNLAFYTPSGWPASFFLAGSAGSMTASTSFAAGSTIYLKMAWVNNGSAALATSFTRSVVIKNASGSVVGSWDLTGNKALGVNYFTASTNDLSGCSAGTYTLTVKLDSGGAISESNENDNAKTLTFTVKSAASLALGASSRTFTASAASGAGLGVTANVAWTAKSSASWLTVKTASGSGNGTVVYNVAANTGTSSRSGTITVTGGGLTRTFTVTQSGAAASLTLAASSRSFTAAAASSKELGVTAKVKWTAKSSASWLAVKTASGSGNGKIIYNVAANTGTGSRTAKITVTGGGVTRTFTVTQSGKSALELGASSRSFGAAAANSKELAVTAKVKWTAKSSASWLVLKTASGSGNGKVVYNVAANAGTSARTAKITVTGGGVTRTFTVTQSGKGGSGTAASLALGASSRTFTAAAASGKELAVSANVKWTAKSSASWLALQTASGSGSGKIVYKVAANTGTSARTAKITVTGGGLTRTFTVTQSGKGGSGTAASLALGASSRTFTASAASGAGLGVTANVAWTAKSSASWLTVKTASGSGNGTVVYNVAANTGTSSRSGTITVTGGGLTRTFTVTQSGAAQSSGGGGSASLSFTAAGGTKTASFSGVAMGYSSLSYSVSWLSANYSLTSGNMTSGGTFTAKINVTAAANTTGGSRSGKVTLTAGGKTYTVNVTQTATKAKSASKTSSPVWVTTCDGSDGAAVADGDETTGWSPAGRGGAWVALSFAEPQEIGRVTVKGEELPEGLRALVSEDGDDWSEEGSDAASYLWVVLPDEGGAPTVSEIEYAP